MFANRVVKPSSAQIREAVEAGEREEREERLRQSTQCYQFLRRQGMAGHYPDWQVKEKGAAPGVILHGDTKSGAKKKVFVKEYEEIFRACHQDEDLLDFAVLSIAKKCGGRVPKAKLKGASDDKVFMFSTDIAQEKVKHPERKYKFYEFCDDEINVSSPSVISARHRIFDQKRDFAADKVSVARLLMLGIILNIWDLHDENAGIVFSSEGNAKLTFIDFLIYVENLENDQQYGLDGFIRAHYANMHLDNGMNALISGVKVADCIEAFKKIEMNFHAACTHALEKINKLSFVADDRKLHMTDVFKIWEQNYMLMQSMVMKAKNMSSIFTKLK